MEISSNRVSGGSVLLEMAGVYAGYGGGDILKGVNLKILEGGITCVVGPNGAGKSTLLNTISGLLKARSGDVTFMGKSISGYSTRQVLESGIVQVPQNHSLFRKMTVRENVEFGAFLLKDRELIRRRFDEVAKQFPIVLEREKEKAGSLSGGQQRLVEFARCLMLDPKLVVLDEPSMGLDPPTLKKVFETVKAMRAGGRTVLLVEQNAKAGLKLADYGVVLENGVVRLDGTGREVLEHPEIAALYLGGMATRSEAR